MSLGRLRKLAGDEGVDWRADFGERRAQRDDGPAGRDTDHHAAAAHLERFLQALFGETPDFRAYAIQRLLAREQGHHRGPVPAKQTIGFRKVTLEMLAHAIEDAVAQGIPVARIDGVNALNDSGQHVLRAGRLDRLLKTQLGGATLRQAGATIQLRAVDRGDALFAPLDFDAQGLRQLGSFGLLTGGFLAHDIEALGHAQLQFVDVLDRGSALELLRDFLEALRRLLTTRADADHGLGEHRDHVLKFRAL